MFLCWVVQGVKENNIMQYLKNKTGESNKDFIVTQLRTMETKINCSMVAVDFSHKDKLYKPRGVDLENSENPII